jgi:hypothetical protein
MPYILNTIREEPLHESDDPMRSKLGVRVETKQTGTSSIW